jgi:hypothetical protein
VYTANATTSSRGTSIGGGGFIPTARFSHHSPVASESSFACFAPNNSADSNSAALTKSPASNTADTIATP